ncbi:MAG: hypothetical protein H6970_15445 [Gammaproteobacteria bacterium]|nr:hypothetical protein [Gammaproteobacteria bacterium]
MPNFINRLREDSNAVQHGAQAKPLRAHSSCEIVMQLESTPETANGQLRFQGTALFNGPHTAAGQTDTYVVRPERIKECLDNLNKGAGSGPGSRLVFGNAWRDEASDTISVGWVTTAISAQKQQTGLNGHQRRRIEEAYAQMPVLEFTNVNAGRGEPTRIRWPLGLDSIETRVNTGGKWEAVTFARPWLAGKLAEAWEARAQEKVSINLRLPVLYPDQAVAVQDLVSAKAGLMKLLGENPYRSVLTRLSDEDTVESRWQPLMRGTDPAAWADRLLARTPGFDAQGQPVADPHTGEQVRVDAFSLIPGIDNRLLLNAAQAGQVSLEFLPRESLLVATKKAPGLAHDVNGILQADSNTQLHKIAFAFGTDPTAVARVALVLQETEDQSRTYVVAGPHRLEPGPTFSVNSVPSAHIQWHSAPAPEEPPLAEAGPAEGPEPDEGSASESAIPELEDESLDFELDGQVAWNTGEETPTLSGSEEHQTPEVTSPESPNQPADSPPAHFPSPSRTPTPADRPPPPGL